MDNDHEIVSISYINLLELTNINKLLFRLENRFNAVNNLINDVKVNHGLIKRDVEKQSEVHKRSAVDGDEEVA